MQFVADDLDVRTLPADHFLGNAADRLAIGVILIDQVNLFGALFLCNCGRECVDLRVYVAVEAEMPEVAFLVGQRRIDGRMVQVKDFVAGISLVVLEHALAQRMADVGTVALRDVVDALVDCLLERDQALLRTGFVVEFDHLELDAAEYAAAGVDLIDRRLDMAAARFPLPRGRAAPRVGGGNLYGVGPPNARRKQAEAGPGQPDPPNTL